MNEWTWRHREMRMGDWRCPMCGDVRGGRHDHPCARCGAYEEWIAWERVPEQAPPGVEWAYTKAQQRYNADVERKLASGEWRIQSNGTALYYYKRERVRLVLDHDHVTGRPRAYVCTPCNVFIGKYEHRFLYLQQSKKTVRYLRRYGALRRALDPRQLLLEDEM